MARTAIAINGEYKQRYSIYVTPTEYAELSKTLSVLRNTESKDDSDTNNVLRNKELTKSGPLTITLRDEEEKDTVMDILSILRDPKGAKDFVDFVQSDVFDHGRAERLMFGYRFWERQEV